MSHWNRRRKPLPVYPPPGHKEPPPLFAIVDPKLGLVVARGMIEIKARRLLNSWTLRHGAAVMVPESHDWAPPSALIAAAANAPSWQKGGVA